MSRRSTRKTARPTEPDRSAPAETAPGRSAPASTSSQVARGLYALIGEVTEDGFVFRVDLALRPNGNSGPPVVSLAMLDEYLQSHGREWERFAWLKSRVVAPRASVRERPRAGAALAGHAFVYRRYLDYGVFEGLRQLHAQGARRGAAPRRRPAAARQRRQAVARRHPRDRVHRPAAAGRARRPVPRDPHPLDAEGARQARRRRPDEARQRRAARRRPTRCCAGSSTASSTSTTSRPTSCRRTTATWPGSPPAWAPSASGACALLDLLGEAREFVAAEFDLLLHDGRRPAAPARCRTCGPTPAPVDAEAFLAQLPAGAARRASGRCATSRRSACCATRARSVSPASSRAPRRRCAQGRCTLHAAVLFIDWLEPLLRRESYLALLAERPEVQNRLLRLLGLARWPMRYLMLHPGVIDELADERLLHGRFDPRRPTRASSRSATPAGSARARPKKSCCSTPCAAPTTPRSFARWCATSRATSPSRRSPTICRRWPTPRSRARCAGPGST